MGCRFLARIAGLALGHVCPDPRLSGHVCHKPRTTTTGPWGLWATTPVERGMCATSPKDGQGSAACSQLRGHTVNVASITRRRTDLAGLLGDLAKMALLGRLPFSRGDRVSRVGPQAPLGQRQELKGCNGSVTGGWVAGVAA
jgi:hypothetical protein